MIVSGAFSKGGWAFMKDAMAHPDRYFSGDRWVLGDYATANIDPRQTRARSEVALLWRFSQGMAQLI